MKVYTIRAGLDGQYVDLLSGRQKKPVRLHLVGAHVPVDDPFQFRGTRCELIALSILADHCKDLDGAVLRGRARSWKLHRKFLAECLEVRNDVITNGSSVDTLDIRRWMLEKTRKAKQSSLFETEDGWSANRVSQ